MSGKKLSVEEMMVSLTLKKYNEKRESGGGGAAEEPVGGSITYTVASSDGGQTSYKAQAIGRSI